MKIRKATKQDAADLAYLIDLAGEGLGSYLWSEMAEPGQTPLEVGALRAARDEGNFSYRNMKVCVEGDEVLGMLLGYPQPDSYDIDDLDDLPPVVRPLIELEAKAPGSWYVNGLAIYELHQGKGIGSLLMAEAESLARAANCSTLSLIAASENRGARKLYERLGYQAGCRRPVFEFPGCKHGGDWVLMTRSVGNPH